MSELLLLQAMHTVEGMSSAHVNFVSDEQSGTLRTHGWLERVDLQYHWSKRSHWKDFDSFLQDMDSKHRKNIKRERRLVRDTGIAFRVVSGAQLSVQDMDTAHSLYLTTFADYGNYPALTVDFFRTLREEMADHVVLIFAEINGQTVAGAVCLRSDTTLYGRYWGSRVAVPGLHFETCYYRGIDYCLRHGLNAFEPGAQGVHKIDRGFLPTLTRSAHRIQDSSFEVAIGDWCRQAKAATLRELDVLNRSSPFRDLRP